MNARVVPWLMRGSFLIRYSKNFMFMFMVMVVAQPLLHVAAHHYGWNFASERPFTSGAFWLNCVGIALGSSLVSAFMLGTRKKDDG